MHDSLLVGYSVDGERRTLSLRLRPHHGNAPGPFRIEFDGVFAHRFDAPLLPAIVSDLEEAPAAALIEDEWDDIQARERRNGWPGGAWKIGDLQAARAYVEREGLNAYWLSSSYGLDGWVLARSVRLVAEPP
ncbi:hypothetical protein J5226_23795 [Lysobacter sp. K5869]|uniref:hypothetical protein n=1 Tax=Lysobacter sp. K5869 TaxID=2820808 RepID=UPI001C060B5C|nr:hypothetical protein [Lysobacter sp. K5869]QWP76565.1 hypothetical protein J5226_23795 [Lysobacter sp. K5869]